MPLDTSTEVIRALLQMWRLNGAGKPLGRRVQGKLSSAAGSWLFSRVKVSDAQGLSSLAELCVSNINNVSDAADVSSIKFQDTSLHTHFLWLLAELQGITHFYCLLSVSQG